MRTSARRSKRFAGLMTAGLMAALIPGIYLPAQAATTWVVNDDLLGSAPCDAPDYTSIQAAIDAGTTLGGDTIEVCAGTYAESVIVDKDLTINGPNAGVLANDPRVLPEATVTSPTEAFSTTVDGVTIDGFDISAGNMAIAVGGAAGGSNNSGVVIRSNIASSPVRALSVIGSGSNIEISQNVFISDSRQFHLTPDSTGFTSLIVDGNQFSGNASTGIQFCCNDPLDIDGFQFTNNEVAGGNTNIGVFVLNGDISNNTFSSPTDSPLLQASLHDSTVSNNTFNGGGTERCLQLFGVQFGLDASTNVAVSDNEFNDCNTYAIQLSEGVDQIDIFHNHFVDTVGDAIATRLRFAGDAPGPEPPPAEWTLNSDIHINFNNITGSTGLGVNNTVTGILDAEDNWWGDASGPGPVGPGSGDGVSANVDYDPWLCAPWDSGDDCAYDDVAPGGSVTTDPGTGPAPGDSTTTTVVTPVGGPVTITESDTHTQPEPVGYSFLGQEVSITADPSPNPNPLVITFKLDASIVAGIDPGDVVVRKGGVDVPDCDPGNGTSAIPDPCVESRTIDGNGDLVLVVYTTSASIWDFLEPTPICTITGTPGPDYLEGTPGADVICGLGGDDIIVGRGGGDELHGQGDNDTLYGNNGGDFMFGGGGNDDFFGGPGNNEIYGGLGQDRMWGGFGDELMSGGDGHDLMVGRFGSDDFDGGPGDDTIIGGDGNDQIDAGEGNNDVYAGIGADTITAGAGNDRLRGGGGDDSITAGDGNNEIVAGDGNNLVTAGIGNDYVDAGLGSDIIDVDGGNDSVFAGHGNNVIFLGEGDNYSLSGTGMDLVTSGAGIDKIETGLGDDTVNSGDGNDALYLGDGNNTANAGNGNNYVLGGPGIDNITTGTGDDRIDAEGGNNIVNAGDGANAIFTGPGNNSLATGSGADFILAGLGADTIFSGGGNDIVFAGRGTNDINGEGGDDYLVGGEDNDDFDGGANTDTCDAGSLGFDTQVNCEVLIGTFP